MPQQGGKSGGSQGGGYQQYMDYTKYMSQGGGKSGGSQGGDFKQYMDYQKYMPQQGGKSGGSQGGDYQQYMDYQKYMSQGSGKTGGEQKENAKEGKQRLDAPVNLISIGSKSDSDDDHVAHGKKFCQNYVGDVKNWSNKEDVRNAFVNKYAGNYIKDVKENTKTEDSDINLNAVDSKSEGSKYSKYFNKYVPDVKNWSNREQVSDAFLDKFLASTRKMQKRRK